MCGQLSVTGTAGHYTGQNTDKINTYCTRIEIKILDPAGNRTRTGRLEGRDSTDHATTMNSIIIITRLEMFVQGMQIQVKHDTYLA